MTTSVPRPSDDETIDFEETYFVVKQDGAEILRLKAKEEISIGRRASNDIRLNSAEIAGSHAIVVFTEGQFLMIDQRGTNGTSINGRRITAPTVFSKESTFLLGKFSLTMVGQNSLSQI